MPAAAQQPAVGASLAQFWPVPLLHDPAPLVRDAHVPPAHGAHMLPVRDVRVPPVRDAPVPLAVVGHLKDSAAEVVESPMVNAGAASGLLLRSDLVPAQAFAARAGPAVASALVEVAARVDFAVPDLAAAAERGSCPSAALAPDSPALNGAGDPSGTENHRIPDVWQDRTASCRPRAVDATGHARRCWGIHSYQDVPCAILCEMQPRSRLV